MTVPIRLLLLSMSLLLGACGERGGQQTGAEGGAPARRAPPAGPSALARLEWKDLVPAGWQPDDPLEGHDVAALGDDDPRARALMARLKAVWAEAPVVDALDGRRVTLSGFVLPLASGASEMPEFLLVPYFGACIHVPPPPANQTVRVVMADGAPYHGEQFDSVQVEGRLRVAPFHNALGDAGYRIEDATARLDEEE